MSDQTIRIGVLAASRIASKAVIEPAKGIDGVEVVAVAARSLERAQDAAAQWGIKGAYGSYDELIAASDVDAIYIGTPSALHREWAIAAIQAGKHVLCEKPLAANADDARAIAEVADAHPDIVAMEAFHWRYHPYTEQIRAVIDGGSLGKIKTIEAVFDLADGHIPRDDIRWDLDIGGGATMDLGCYPIQWVRFAAQADPTVVGAAAVTPVTEIDASLTATLKWPAVVDREVVHGMIRSSMIADSSQNWLRVVGEAGEMVATNPLAPQIGGAELKVTVDGVTSVEAVDTTPTYHFQMIAFRDAITKGTPFPTTMRDGVINMEIIDACYRAAGLLPRPTA